VTAMGHASVIGPISPIRLIAGYTDREPPPTATGLWPDRPVEKHGKAKPCFAKSGAQPYRFLVDRRLLAVNGLPTLPSGLRVLHCPGPMGRRGEVPDSGI
jgi:hypothetical protein